jgi:hypothetical protein
VTFTIINVPAILLTIIGCLELEAIRAIARVRSRADQVNTRTFRATRVPLALVQVAAHQLFWWDARLTICWTMGLDRLRGTEFAASSEPSVASEDRGQSEDQ